MPVQVFLILLAVVIGAAGVTIALAYAFGSLVWLGFAALLAALAVRRWV